MKTTETRETLYVLALAALALYAFFGKPWLLYLGAFFIIISLKDNPLGRFTAKAWLTFAAGFARINSALVLGLVFYLLLTPLALCRRLFNGGAGRFTADPGATLFEDVPAAACARESFEKTW